MGTYLSSPLSGKEVASGACESMGLRWGVCSMQGWRVSMEDAHLVLYAKRVGCTSATSTGGVPPNASPRDGALPDTAGAQLQQQKDELSPLGPKLPAGGVQQHLLSQLLLGSGPGAGPGPQRSTDSCYVFLPTEVELHKDEIGGLSSSAAAGPVTAASSAAEDGGDAADVEAGEAAEGDAAATPSSKKTKVGRVVRRQFTLRRRGTSTVSEADAADASTVGAAAAPSAAAGAGPPAVSQARGGPAGQEAVGTISSSSQTVQHADLCIFAVFDGHGGAHVSRFAAAHMRPLLECQAAFHRGDLSTALRSAYLRIDDLLREESSQDDLLYLTSHSPHQLLQHKQQLQQEQQQQQQEQDASAAAAAPAPHKGLRSTLSNLGQHFGVKSQQQQQQTAPGQLGRAGVSSSGVAEAPSKQQTGSFAARGAEEEVQGRPLRGGAEDSLATFSIQATAAATAAAANAAAAERSTARSGAAAILAAYAANGPDSPATPRGRLSYVADADSPAAAAAAAAATAAAAAVAASDPPAAASDDEVAAAAAAAVTAAAAAGTSPSEETGATKKGKKLSFSGLVDVVTRSVGLGRLFGRSNGSSSSGRSLASTAGSTALTVCVTPTRLIVANVGDSRCVLCRGREIIELSQDHKPQLAEERIRIYAAGGFLEMGRVNGNLNLSRALGDLVYKADDSLPPEKQILSGCPDVVTVNRDPEKDEFLVIGCDGIWELLSSAEVVEFVRRRIEHTPDLCQILKELFDSLISPNPALFEYGCDNMTAFIVDLQAEKRRQLPAASSSGAGLSASQEQQEQPDIRRFSKTSSTESLSGSVYGDGDLRQTNQETLSQEEQQPPQQQHPPPQPQQQQQGHQEEESGGRP